MPPLKTATTLALLSMVAVSWSGAADAGAAKPVAILYATNQGGTDAGASCSGTSPLSNGCTKGGTLDCCSVALQLDPAIGYTGRLTAVVSTSTGSFEFSCNYAGGVSIGCNRVDSGTMFVGQGYTFRVASQPLVGVAVGIWSAELQNP